MGCPRPGSAWICVSWEQIRAATLRISDQFCQINRSWWFEERCAAMPFETTLVMAVCALDCGQDFVVCETFISSVTEVLREGRHVRQFYITSDVNEMCGVLCWQRCGTDHGGSGKLMWHGIMEEFKCKATSAWSRQFGEQKARMGSATALQQRAVVEVRLSLQSCRNSRIPVGPS